MKPVLILYFSRGGHTAKISHEIAKHLEHYGRSCEIKHIREANKVEPDWDKYASVIVGACVLYGGYDRSVLKFTAKYHKQLSSLPNSFYCVNVVARNPEKRIPENNKYLQKFFELSEWKPQDVKIIAGKVDYPAWPWWDRLMIRLIMKMTNGPTDPKAVIDYTDWADLKVYAKHIISLTESPMNPGFN